MQRAWLVIACAGVGLMGGIGCSSTTDVGPPFAGRHSYLVTASVTNDSGGRPLFSHQFTMVIDVDAATAIAGDAGRAAIVPLAVTSPTTLSVSEPIGFTSDVGGADWTIRYVDVTISSAPNGALRGTARGTAVGFNASSDVGQPATVTAALAGIPDTLAPVLTVWRNGAADDPLSSLTVTASEPVMPGALPVLVTGGASVPLNLPTNASIAFNHDFSGPPTLLRYGQDYQVRVDGITDFAGLPASGGAAFTTRAAPPLVAEDGFESATGTLGGAQVLTGAGAPTLSGAASLYIPPMSGTGLDTGRARTTQLALRLAVAAGDTVVRFAYRVVNPNAYPGQQYVYVGSEGGALAAVELESSGTTTATIPGQGDVALGPLTTAEVLLPADVGSEVVVLETLSAVYGAPLPPAPGLIIDDLRVE